MGQLESLGIKPQRPSLVSIWRARISAAFSRRSIAESFDVQPRVWLYFYAILVGMAAFSISGVGIYYGSAVWLLSGTFIWLLWFALMFAICIPAMNRILAPGIRWLRGGALVIMGLFMLVGLIELLGIQPFSRQAIQSFGKAFPPVRPLVSLASGGFRYTDGIALTEQATQNIIEGKDPYNSSDVVTALQIFGQGSGQQITPLKLGTLAGAFPYPTRQELDSLWQQAAANPGQVPPEFESKFNYPAGSFLLPAPLLLFGVRNLLTAYMVYVLASLVIVLWLLRRHGWPVFLLGVLASLQLWNSVAIGETGTAWFAPFIIAWLLLKKNWWLSALAMGLAVAAKQTAWFFLPFYLVLVVRSMGVRQSLKVTGIVGGVFLAANLPFIIDGPKMWLVSVLAPMIDPMFPTGSGIITLVLSGLVNIRTPLLFTVLEVLVLAGGIVWYYFNCRKYPHAGLVLALFPLFFAWRSIQSHFFFLDIVLLAAVLFEGQAVRRSGQREPEVSKSVLSRLPADSG